MAESDARRKVERRERIERQDPGHEQQREALRLAYGRFIATVFPSLNDIGARVELGAEGLELMVYHPFFSQYTFASGPQAQAVFEWVVEHRPALEECHVTQVGVSSPQRSEAFFKLSPGTRPTMGSQGSIIY